MTTEAIALFRKFGLHASADALAYREAKTCRTCVHLDSDPRDEPCVTCRRFELLEGAAGVGPRGWYFQRMGPTGTVLAIEPDGKRHVVKNGDLNSLDGRALMEAMTAALTHGGVMASDAPLPPDVLYDLAIQAGLGDELWFGKHMPKNPDYEDATPKLEKFAKLVRSYGVLAVQAPKPDALLNLIFGEYADACMKWGADSDLGADSRHKPTLDALEARIREAVTRGVLASDGGQR